MSVENNQGEIMIYIVLFEDGTMSFYRNKPSDGIGGCPKIYKTSETTTISEISDWYASNFQNRKFELVTEEQI